MPQCLHHISFSTQGALSSFFSFLCLAIVVTSETLVKNPGPSKIPLCGGRPDFEPLPEGALDLFPYMRK